MAELALIAGMNYFGNNKNNKNNKNNNSIKTPTSNNNKTNDQIILDDYKNTAYHTSTVNKTQKEYKAKVDKRSKEVDLNKYMIPSFHITDDVIGAGMDDNDDVETSFLDQFELQRASNKSVKAKNEDMNCLATKWSTFEEGDDMTLGVIPVSDERFKHNNMEAFNHMRDSVATDYEDTRPIELFTGYSENYVPKRELKPLFEPVKNSTIGNQMTSVYEERIQDTVGITRNGDKLFESRQVGPGLNLDEEMDTMGGVRDTTRIMPLVGNDLRRADNPQISYEAPVIPGKKGSKRPVAAKFERRHEDDFEIDRVQYASGGLSAQRNNDNYTNRATDKNISKPVVGAKGGITSVYDPRREGKIKESVKKTYEGVIGHASAPNKRNTENINTYRVDDTQRMYTNQEYFGNIQSGHKSAILSKNEQMKAKQVLPVQPSGAPNRNTGQIAFNSKQIIQSKQQLEAFQNGHASRGTVGGIAFDPNDRARDTLRQTTSQINRSTFINGGWTANRTQLQDDARTTMTQNMVAIPRSTFIGGYDANTTALQDDVRVTVKQDMVQKPTLGHGGLHTNQGYTLDKSTAPITLRQLVNYNNYRGGAGSTSINTNNPVDTNIYYAPTTLKQLHNIQDYKGGVGFAYAPDNRMQYDNATINSNRDAVTQGRAPTRANVSAIPTTDNMGYTSFQEENNYVYVNPPKQRGNDFNPNMNVFERTMPYHNDNIILENTLDTNPYNQDYYH